uniref:Uncharacterized protein n=1 Tax=Rhizophora mucronata TaxID=61149 RepID=A0A2P2JG65_RHIMU
MPRSLVFSASLSFFLLSCFTSCI